MAKIFSLIGLLLLFCNPAQAARCLFVSSYHQGYAWADGIEQGVRSVLEPACELRQLNMDTKRNRSEQYKLDVAAGIKRFIDAWRPDVVIVADDNASKYLVAPYFKDGDLPFVFCGINWTVEEYGYPYRNVTGMIEVSPIKEIYGKIRQIVPAARTGVYLGADTLTEEKSYHYFAKAALASDMALERRLVKSQAEWTAAYIEAQQHDFVILGTESGIDDWDNNHAADTVIHHGTKLSITTYDWLMRFAAFGVLKVPQEHGEWAGRAALDILKGVPPGDIPIIPSQRWDMMINPLLIERLESPLPAYILAKSKKFYAR